jgi:hypothetical protein
MQNEYQSLLLGIITLLIFCNFHFFYLFQQQLPFLLQFLFVILNKLYFINHKIVLFLDYIEDFFEILVYFHKIYGIILS